MLGRNLIWLLFAASLLSSACYFLSYSKKKDLLIISRKFFLFVILGIALVSGIFLENILSHNFQYFYVWNFSSKDLPFYLLLSTFFAGQEGSFLLWGLFLAIIGGLLQQYTRKNGYEPLAMGLFTLIMAFLLLMLIVKSPFNYVWEIFSDIKEGFMPTDGRGLNPILENFWMIIHPPVLFAGYAAVTIPYIFAISGLIKKDYNGWITISFRWTICASAILGIGIILGGFWAYETLGWGGFWGWDPVENSSLLPWLTTIALIHTLNIQRKTGGLVKTNFILAILSFILVLYGTFLTRSGILGDTTVHGFDDSGSFANTLLIFFLAVFLIIGIITFLIRIKDINSKRNNFKVSSKEFIITSGVILLLASTIIIFLGTNFPLLLEFTGRKKSAVNISFYNNWNTPFVSVMLILISLSLYYKWGFGRISSVLRKSIYSLSAAVILSIIIVIYGVNNSNDILLLFASLFCLFVNIELFFNKLRKKTSSLGTFISHIGLSALMLGIIGSSTFSQTKALSLIEGEAQAAFGYEFTFVGGKQIQKELTDRLKYELLIKIAHSESISYVKPIIFWSDYNKRVSPFIEPGIKIFPLEDVYISAKSLDQTSSIPSLMLTKGQSKIIPLDSTISLSLSGFDKSHAFDSSAPNFFNFGAIVKIFNTDSKDTSRTDTIYMKYNMQDESNLPIWKSIPESKYYIGFIQFIPEGEKMSNSQAVFGFTDSIENIPQPKNLLIIQLSIKPYMNLVWIGVILIIIGMFFSVFKRRVT